MGFPLGYTDLFFPKLLIHTLTLLSLLRKFISILLRALGLSDFLEPEVSWSTRPDSTVDEYSCVSAALMREFLPVVKYSDITDAPDSCAVCLYEFTPTDEIRRLTNCRHVFHRSCVDRWMDHDQKTCPLCRTPFISGDLQDEFNERLWATSGISDYYGEYSPISSNL